MRSRRIRLVAGLALLAACGGLVGADFASRPARIADVAVSKPPRILVVNIDGVIDRVQDAFLQRSLSGAKERYDAFIFDISSLGGRTDYMAKMSDAIVALAPKPTIAFVSKEAMSAASFIAMSCDRIYMTPLARIGAARPWVRGPDGMPVVLPEYLDEKGLSDLRAQFRGLAQHKHYPVAIAEGMVDEKLEIHKVTIDGETRYVKGDEMERILADPVQSSRIKDRQVISAKGNLIAFYAGEAVAHGIATRVVDSLDKVLEAEGVAGAEQVVRALNWSDRAIAILTMGEVVTLLVLIGFGGVWLELKTPGFGAGGTIAIVAFLLIFGSQFLVGNANALEILLFVVGLVLLGIEVFVTPGFGVMGTLGIVCIFVSLVLSMQSFTLPRTPWQTDALRVNLLATIGGLAGSFVVLALLAWLLPSTRLFRRFALARELRSDDGFASGDDHPESLVGRVGTTVTALRPAGKLEIGDNTYSVVSDTGFIDAGQRARVIRVDGTKILVEPVAPDKTGRA